MTDLGTLGGTSSHGLAINTAGQVTGAASLPGDSLFHAFRSDGTTMTDLGTLGGAYSSGAAINTAGQVTGYALLPGNSSNHAFVAFSGGGMLDLNGLIPSGSGWELLQGNAINDTGQITGVGIINGQQHAFLLRPVAAFTGFFPPVDNLPTVNAVKAGAAVPSQVQPRRRPRAADFRERLPEVAADDLQW